MKKNSFLVKTVLMSMLTAVSISFASCSDDDDLMTNPYTTDDSEVAMTRGGSASDAFKPNVDHSQWMAQLNNSRLVADLSLLNYDLGQRIIELGLPFDQLIFEDYYVEYVAGRPQNCCRWIHVSYGPRNRRQIIYEKLKNEKLKQS